MDRIKTDQRVSVERIAQEIERNIQAHDETKPDWQETDLKVLIAELEGEVQELLQEPDRGRADAHISQPRQKERTSA